MQFLRLPLEGSIDLTYRCNNNCRHCWINIPAGSLEKDKELTFGEIKKIADDARAMGCRRWSISGGEPMLREDFAEIFDFLTSGNLPYSLNTNGTLITQKIARLMKRKGVKMVALYGATAKVHDHITRRPGSFDETMRGFAYLKEENVGFIVQLMVMRDNYHQYKAMKKLAESLSEHWRFGGSWLYLSADNNTVKNEEIRRQRLAPIDAMLVNKPYVNSLYRPDIVTKSNFACQTGSNSNIFSSCFLSRQMFYLNPYGEMSSCVFVKEPLLCYNLRQGNFEHGWNKFIPSAAYTLRHTQEYYGNCAVCELRQDCKWCPVYSYLEHRTFSKKIEYLCQISRVSKEWKKQWCARHRRYYRIADITLQVDSDLPMSNKTFNSKLKLFEANGSTDDTIMVRHHFSIPSLNKRNMGTLINKSRTREIYKNKDSWIYLCFHPVSRYKRIFYLATCDKGHKNIAIYHKDKKWFTGRKLRFISFPSTDQILLANILADRQGCIFHASGVKLGDKGFLFVGNSGAGKSTIAKMFKNKAEVLCDERIIVRRKEGSFRIYGTWHYGTFSKISAQSALLAAVFFLEKARDNLCIRVESKSNISLKLMDCVSRSVVTAEWWQKTLNVIERIAEDVPCYRLRFDKSRAAVEMLKQIGKN